MGQDLIWLKRIFRKKTKYSPYRNSSSYYLEHNYKLYFEYRLKNEECFINDFIHFLDIIKINEIIEFHYDERNSKQKKLIEYLNKNAFYPVNNYTQSHINKIKEYSRISSNFGCFLLYLIEQKDYYTNLLKNNYLLEMCHSANKAVLHHIDMEIIKYKDLVINELVDIAKVNNYRYTCEQVIMAYVVFEKKIADNYFKEATITGNIYKKIPFEMILSVKLIGDDTPYLPNILFLNNKVVIDKVDLNEIKKNLLKSGSCSQQFSLSHYLNPKNIKDYVKLKNGFSNLFKYLDSNFSENEVQIFFDSLTRIRILENDYTEFVRVQEKINDLLENEKNRWLFLCSIYLLKDYIKSKNDLIKTFKSYFKGELELGESTFSKFIYRDGGANIDPYIQKYRKDLSEIHPMELKMHTVK